LSGQNFEKESSLVFALLAGDSYTLTFQGTTTSGGAASFIDLVDVDSLATPLPAALPLFAGGLGVIGLLQWRRKRKAQA
jgi:hypothetical protein